MPIMTICVAYHDHMYGLTRPYVWVNATICVDSDAYFRWEALLFTSKRRFNRLFTLDVPSRWRLSDKGIVTDKGIFQSKGKIT